MQSNVHNGWKAAIGGDHHDLPSQACAAFRWGLLFDGELAELRAEIILCVSACGGGSRKSLVND